jgi:cytochrome c oxidase subunit 2
MAAEAEAAPQGTEAAGPNHGLRIFLIWLPVALAADLLLWFVYGPHMPPGTMASAANGQQFDIKVMSVMAAPVMAFVLCYAGYALIVWRQRPGDETDGPPIQGNARIQATWITVTSVIVLALFGFGTFELANSHSAGAGSGQGPSPIWKPPVAASKILQIQVIGQQWKFTYRYPKQYDYFETSQLVLPANTWVQFNVTSIDVIHSFWAYQLGVKADANPGVNNVAYTEPTHLGTFVVRCAELCGLWHGAMFDYGYVVTQAQFHLWATKTEAQLADITKLLPPYATTYDPTVVKQMSAAMVKGGLTGAPGLFYPPQDPVQP